MLKTACLIAGKDLRLLLVRGTGLVQALLLGLLLIFIFSLSQKIGDTLSPQGAAAIFWICTMFCQVLVFNSLYSLEEVNGQRAGLVLAPVMEQGIWLGKAAAGLVLIILAQCVFFPAILVFLGQQLNTALLLTTGTAVLFTNLGMVAVGSLLGALLQGASVSESLLSVIIFPLLIPLLLAAIRLGALLFDTSISSITEDASSWFGIIIAFDAMFFAAALVLFPFLYKGA